MYIMLHTEIHSVVTKSVMKMQITIIINCISLVIIETES